MNGSLEDYSPAGALRVLSSTGKTGAVRFTGAAGCTVYLHEGQLYFARGEDTDQVLASALVRAGRVDAAAWTEAAAQAGDRPVVGETLVATGALDADLLASVVLSVVYDPLIELFRQGDGTFEFEPETMHWMGPFHPFNVDAIVNEVRRRVREVDEMSHTIGSLETWVSPSRTLPEGASQVTLLREDWELVTCLGSPLSIAELADDMGRGRWSTARVVARLAEAGLVSVVPMTLGQTADEELTSVPEPTEQGGEAPEPDPGTDAEAGPGAGPPAEADAEAEIGAADLTEREAEDGAGPGTHGVAGVEVGVGADDGPTGPTEADRATADRGPFGLREIDEPSPGVVNEFAAAWAATEAEEDFDPATAFEHEPIASPGNNYDPRVAVDTAPEDRTDEANPLPVRGSVALSEEPASNRTAPWPAAEDLDDAPADQSLSALAGIGGFQEVGTPTQHESAEDYDSRLHPNAEWLEGLYAQFIDEPEEEGGKKRKKEALDVAFAADPVPDEGEKVGTMRRLMDALRRL